LPATATERRGIQYRMLLDGWCPRFVRPVIGVSEAGGVRDFLVGDLDENNYFRTTGLMSVPARSRLHLCCAWAIYRFGELSGERVIRSAVKVIEAALRQQQANGWFAHNCLTRSQAPLTHTIATLSKGFRVGLLAQTSGFCGCGDEVRRCT